MGAFIYLMMLSLGEITTHMPGSGGFTKFTAQFIDPAIGFAVGWNYFYCFAITLPAEITAASIVIQYWDSNENHLAGYITLMLIVAILTNLLGARGYGEAEFWAAVSRYAIMINYCLIVSDHQGAGYRRLDLPRSVA